MRLNKNILMGVFALMFVMPISASDWARHDKYLEINKLLPPPPIHTTTTIASSSESGRIVFIGNSIVERWIKSRPQFFVESGIIGRGISGQVSAQMLARFQQDVVSLQPSIVLIMAGTNDIAQNNGEIELSYIVENVKSMCEIAKYNGIYPIVCSVLPAHSFYWRPNIKPEKEIAALNKMLQLYASENNIKYIDFYSLLDDGMGGMPFIYAEDGVHPSQVAYSKMEELIYTTIFSNY